MEFSPYTVASALIIGVPSISTAVYGPSMPLMRMLFVKQTPQSTCCTSPGRNDMLSMTVLLTLRCRNAGVTSSTFTGESER